MEKDLELNQQSIDPKKAIKSIKNSSWSYEDQLYFFTHPGVGNMTYPCTTTLGGMTPGKPCLFPVIYLGKATNNCMDFESSNPGCFTRKGSKLYVTKKHWHDWGYCKPECDGQNIGPNSSYNLAKSEFSKYWKTVYYDLSPFENGICHTYDPPENLSPEFLNRAYFMFKNDTNMIHFNYDIFLHEKGQFWPRRDMEIFGLSNAVQVRPNEEVEITFSIIKISNLKQKDNICIEGDYSLTECLFNYVKSKTKCYLDFETTKNQSCTKENFRVRIYQIKTFNMII